MGFIDSLKRTFNISGAEVTITLDDSVHGQNDAVTGEAEVLDGPEDAVLRYLIFEL